MQILLPAETALLGSAMGFYYGSQKARDDRRASISPPRNRRESQRRSFAAGGIRFAASAVY